MTDKDLLPIGKAAKQAGISRQSLQYYLMIGLLEPTRVSDTGRRYFNQDAIDRIKMIRRLNLTGLPLREIREIYLDKNKK